MVVGEFTQEADLVVIGGGPGGYTAAFRAAELGIQTILIDSRPQLGGVCLHEGCIPSKALLHVAETIDRAASAEQFGVRFERPKLEFDRVRAWLGETIGKLANGLTATAKSRGVEVLCGVARFDDSRNLTVANGNITRVRFRRALIATGAAMLEHPKLPLTSDRVWLPSKAVGLPSVPPHIAIVGSGYMAVELAMVYRSFGSNVTLICEAEELLPDADPDLARPLMKALKRQSINVAVGVSILDTSFAGERVEIRTSEAAFELDDVIVADGQRGNTELLQLKRTQVLTDEAGFIKVDHQMRTNDPRILAVGDVTGDELLADVAIQQGRVAAEVVAGWNSAIDTRAVPHAVFTNPQIAWCGLTEREAAMASREITVAKFRWGGSGRAVAMNGADGLTKIICEPDTGLILGVGIVGANAIELIGEAALAIEMGATAVDLAETMHPHPSLCESVRDAAINSGIES